MDKEKFYKAMVKRFGCIPALTDYSSSAKNDIYLDEALSLISDDSEDSMVISKEEYEILTDLSALREQVQEALNINPIEELIQVEREARKQAIMEFAAELENKLDSVDIILHEDNEEQYLSFNGVIDLIDKIAAQRICKQTAANYEDLEKLQ